jgi:hypothetical protein
MCNKRERQQHVARQKQNFLKCKNVAKRIDLNLADPDKQNAARQVLNVGMTRSRFCTMTGTAALVRPDAPGWRLQHITSGLA